MKGFKSEGKTKILFFLRIVRFFLIFRINIRVRSFGSAQPVPRFIVDNGESWSVKCYLDVRESKKRSGYASRRMQKLDRDPTKDPGTYVGVNLAFTRHSRAALLAPGTKHLSLPNSPVLKVNPGHHDCRAGKSMIYYKDNKMYTEYSHDNKK